VSSEGGDADTLMPDVDEASMMSVESLATDDDVSMATSSVSGEGDIVMSDAEEEDDMMSVTEPMDDLQFMMSRLSIAVPPPTDEDVLVAMMSRLSIAVPPLELRRSARLASKSGNTVILLLPVGTLGSVFVNGKRRSARRALF